MPAPYDYASATGYDRARADWIAWPLTTTPIRQADLDRWDQAIRDLKLVVRYVEDFSGSNDSDKIHAALDEVPALGGTVLCTEPSYQLVGGIETSVPNVRLAGVGAGVGQSNLLASGGCIINVPSGVTGFTFNPAAASTLFAGPRLNGLMFKGVAGATGGIKINRTNNFLLDDVCCSNFTSGFGIYSDGTGNVNQYGTIRDAVLGKNLIGLDLKLTNGLRVLGGQIDANDNAGSVLASSTGIRMQSGDTLRATDTVIQFAATGVDLQGTGTTFNSFLGLRTEGCTTHFSVASDYNSIVGCTGSNSIIGGGGTYASIAATGDHNLFWANQATSFAAYITDLGTNTVFSDLTTTTYPFQQWPAGSSFKWASGVLVTSGTGSPEGAITAPKGSLFLRSDGGAGTSSYVKESGTGNTGWVAK